MSLRQRVRNYTIPASTDPYGYRYWGYKGTWYLVTTYKHTTYSDPVVWEEECQDELHPGPPYRSGGPFFLMRTESPYYYTVRDGINWISSDGKYKYEGSIKPSLPSMRNWLSFADMNKYSESALETLGTTGWARAQPLRPQAGLGQFLGEFKDIPRTLMGTAKSFASKWASFKGRKRGGFTSRAASQDWLNANFGWMPFIRDLRDFYNVSKNLEERVAQLKRDNGQWMHRSRTLENSTETTILLDDTYLGHLPALDNGFYVGNSPKGYRRIERIRSNKCWFEGRFKYWIPDLESSPWDARSYAIIFGTMPTPDLIWELVPWSWLVDWVSNAGDVISNVVQSLTNGVTAKYAYVMGSSSEHITGDLHTNFADGPLTTSISAKFLVKRRLAASPFGFGLSSGNFSTWQWSILGALGLSRLR